MTKTKCRELYEQMAKAVMAFEEALNALRKVTHTPPDDHGRIRSEQHARIKGRIDHFNFVDGDRYLMDAGEALEQTVED
jgi:hypothetical protein